MQEQEQAQQVVALPLASVHADPCQPRKHFDEAEIALLAGSIAANGLLQPITVRPTNDGWVVVAGERRLRAHQALGADTVNAIVRSDVESGADITRLQLLENAARVDLGPVEEARAFKAALQDGNEELTDLAKAVGKKPAHIRQALAMLDAPGEVLELVECGQVHPRVAAEIARLPREDQMQAFKKVCALKAEGGTRHNEARLIVEALLHPAPEQGGFELNDTRTDDAACKVGGAFRAAFEQMTAAMETLQGLTRGDMAKLEEWMIPQAGIIEDKLNWGANEMRRFQRIAKRAQCRATAAAD